MGRARAFAVLLQPIGRATPEEVDEITVADAVERLDPVSFPPQERPRSGRLHVHRDRPAVDHRHQALRRLAQVDLPHVATADQPDQTSLQRLSVSQGSRGTASAALAAAGV